MEWVRNIAEICVKEMHPFSKTHSRRLSAQIMPIVCVYRAAFRVLAHRIFSGLKLSFILAA